MKKILTLLLIITALTASSQTDKSKRPSPPGIVIQTLENGTTITIDYSRPSVKGRTIGEELDPYPGKVWRTGANEATVFETDKDINVQGQPLPAGKYGLYTIANGEEWTIIFNKTWKQWGTQYNEANDFLRVSAKAGKAAEFSEQLTFTISKDGKISLLWGDIDVSFIAEK